MKTMRRAALVLVTGSGLLRAQATAVDSAKAALPQIYYDFQVETRVQPSSKNKAPQYPKLLRSSGIEGQVVAQFAVDSGGRVIESTFRVMKSEHDLFSKAVKDILPALRFTPATIGKRRVAQLVQMPFMFSLAGADTGSIGKQRR